MASTDQYGYDWGVPGESSWNVDGSFDYDRNPSTTNDTGNIASQYNRPLPVAPSQKIVMHAKHNTPEQLHELRMREANNSPYLHVLLTQLLDRGVNDQATLDKYQAYLGEQLLTGREGDKVHDQFMTQLGYNPLQAIGQHADPINQAAVQKAYKAQLDQQRLFEEPQSAKGQAAFWDAIFRQSGVGQKASDFHQKGARTDRMVGGVHPYGRNPGIIDTLKAVAGADFGAAKDYFEGSVDANPAAAMLPMPANLAIALGGRNSRGTFYDQFGRNMIIDNQGRITPASVDQDWNFTPTASEGGSEAELIQQLLNPTVSSATPAFNRQTALDELIAGTQAGTVNPGIADSYFNTIIKNGILGRNQALGEDVTQQQFEGTFGSSRLGQELLGEESGRLRGVSRGQIGDVFTGKAFEPITDDTAIDKILSEKQASAFGDISRFGSRGNLSTTGGATAGQFISGREPEARTRLEEIGAGVRESGQRGIDVIRDRALQQAGTFNLGDPFFDIAPFTSERETAIQGRLPSIGPDIRSQLGAERLFDTQAAIREGAESQGLVSGAPSFLDELASRSGQRSQRNRGIGSIGSGVF